MAAKKPQPNEPKPRRRLLQRLIKAPAALSILWPALLLCGGYLAWHRWGADHVASQYYALDPTLIEVTEPPEYIRTSVVDAVYRDTALGDLSLLDARASAKIASAFASHPWVRHVTGVRKLPGGVIDVHVQYRRPVAMVHVISRHPEVSDSSFFAVDGEGTLLPTADFAPAETRQYLHIVVPGAYPTGGVGSPFGDLRVEAAARVAAVLAKYREDAGIASIGVHGDPRRTGAPQFELTTRSGERLFWGSAPGSELAGEPPAAMKLQVLLEGAAPGSDLRMAGRPSPPSHSAE